MASEDMTLDRLWEIVKGLQQSTSKYTRVDLPTDQTMQGRPSLASRGQPKTVTVPDMRNYDLISISYHHDSNAASNTECQLITINELRERKQIMYSWGYHFWNGNVNSAITGCVLVLRYDSDTQLTIRSGDDTSGGIFSPMYFIKF